MPHAYAGEPPDSLPDYRGLDKGSLLEHLSESARLGAVSGHEPSPGPTPEPDPEPPGKAPPAEPDAAPETPGMDRSELIREVVAAVMQELLNLGDGEMDGQADPAGMGGGMAQPPGMDQGQFDQGQYGPGDDDQDPDQLQQYGCGGGSRHYAASSGMNVTTPRMNRYQRDDVSNEATPKTDAERIAELEAKVEALTTRGESLQAQNGELVRYNRSINFKAKLADLKAQGYQIDEQAELADLLEMAERSEDEAAKHLTRITRYARSPVGARGFLQTAQPDAPGAEIDLTPAQREKAFALASAEGISFAAARKRVQAGA